jgi:hypothetical protein
MNNVLASLEQNIKLASGNIMNYIDKILEEVEDNESVGTFAIDSFPKNQKKKKRQIIRTLYPENKDEQIPRRAMIDLDGTIHKYSKGYKDGTIYDNAFDGAKEVIDWLKRNDYEIVIFTTRASKQNADELGGSHKDQIKKIGEWLKDKGIYFDRITAEKLAADFYIDDKAISIYNGDWKTVLKVIKKRIKYKGN